MGSQYLTWLADELRAAGLKVVEYGGWQTRARSSGGYDSGKPLCCMWHHTASNTSPQNDADYMCKNSGDRPIANILVARDGEVWVLAAGATNTNGKGNSLPFSRGSVPSNNMNTHALGMEIANSGTGEEYPQAQIDSAFIVSNVVNRKMGNQPSDVATHQRYAPDRKIDPARGGATVQGTFHPSEVNSSGSWNVTDLINECGTRASGRPPGPQPEPEPEPETWYDHLMASLPTLYQGDRGGGVRVMQHLIACAGYMNEGNVSNYDGVFGSGTASALNRFKQDAGGQPDGVCDAWTWGALMHTIDGIPTIVKGNSGPDVKRMQHLLAANGYLNEANTSNYDGQWGNGTDGAKSRFDNEHGLRPSPPTDCGPKSWESLITGKVW